MVYSAVVGVRENFEKRPIFYFQNNLSPAGRFLLLVSAIGHDTEMHATPLERLIFQMSLDASQKRNVIRLSTPSPPPPPPNGLQSERDLPPVGGWDEEPDDTSD